jgi:hypothetical protein
MSSNGTSGSQGDFTFLRLFTCADCFRTTAHLYDAGHVKSFFFTLSLSSGTLLPPRANRVCPYPFCSSVSP